MLYLSVPPAALQKDMTMQPLSEALLDLAARSKRLENSAAIVRGPKHAALQARLQQQLEALIDREAEEVEQTAADARVVG